MYQRVHRIREWYVTISISPMPVSCLWEASAHAAFAWWWWGTARSSSARACRTRCCSSRRSGASTRRSPGQSVSAHRHEYCSRRVTTVDFLALVHRPYRELVVTLCLCLPSLDDWGHRIQEEEHKDAGITPPLSKKQRKEQQQQQQQKHEAEEDSVTSAAAAAGGGGGSDAEAEESEAAPVAPAAVKAGGTAE